jgi:hypothetical protein
VTDDIENLGGGLETEEVVVIPKRAFDAMIAGKATARHLSAVAVALLGVAVVALCVRILVFDPDREKRAAADANADRAVIIRDLEDVQRILEVVEDATSPETQRKQAEALQGILIRIDCDNRAALEELGTALVEAGVIEPVSLVCKT